MGFFDKLFKRKKTEVDEKREEEIKELLEEGANQHREAEEELDSELKSKIEVELDEEELDEKERDDSLEILADIEDNLEFEDEVESEVKFEVKFEVEKIEEEKEVEKKGFLASLKDKLFNSRQGLFGKLAQFFTGRTIIDDEMYEELEELLVQSDIGLDMSLKIIETLEKEIKKRGTKEPSEVYPILKETMENFLVTEGNSIKLEDNKMNVILIVGVNGVGKTTTIGKMAAKYVKAGKKVVIGAGDTFRAAAVEQV